LKKNFASIILAAGDSDFLINSDEKLFHDTLIKWQEEQFLQLGIKNQNIVLSKNKNLNSKHLKKFVKKSLYWSGAFGTLRFAVKKLENYDFLLFTYLDHIFDNEVLDRFIKEAIKTNKIKIALSKNRANNYKDIINLNQTAYQFAGAIIIPKTYYKNILTVAKNFDESGIASFFTRERFKEFIDYVFIDEYSWREIKSETDLAKLFLGKKSKGLTSFKNKSEFFDIPNFVEINYKDLNILNQKINKLSNKLIIRSNSSNEDSYEKSNAGKYLSIGPLDKRNLKEIILSCKKVFKSYDSEDVSKETIIIQDYIDDAYTVGVATSYNVGTRFPYRTVSLSSGNSTEVITSGNSNNIETFFIHRWLTEAPSKYKTYNSYLKLLNLLENFIGYPSLDIEMLENKTNKPMLLQVRPLVGGTISKEKIKNQYNIITKNLRKYQDNISRKSDRFGNSLIYSNMSDWNPAEMIGKTPDPISVILYKFMITDSTWNKQRVEFGYKKFKDTNLMEIYNGKPFINISFSLNSFLTKSLSDEACERIIKYQINKITKKPEMHDKIEFNIAKTCYQFESFENFSEEYKDIINKSDLINWFQDLKLIDKNNKNILEKNEIKILNAYRKIDTFSDFLNIKTLKFIRDSMALPFAHHARLGFVYISQLNKLLEYEVLSQKEKFQILSNINSVSSKMNQHAYEVKKGKKSLNEFLKVYGHVRPGNYDIRSKSFNENIELVKDIIDTSNFVELQNKVEEYTYKKIQNYFEVSNIQNNAQSWLSLFKKSVELRENSKFYYAKSLDRILNQITKQDISTEELVKYFPSKYFVDYKDFKYLFDSKMPDILSTSTDFYMYEEYSKNGNYIGSNNVSGKVAYLESSDIKTKNLTGKIVVISSADPGWDWIFNYNIAALVTEFGGPNSHMAIRCAEHDKPAVLGIGTSNFNKVIDANKINIEFNKEIINIIK